MRLSRRTTTALLAAALVAAAWLRPTPEAAAQDAPTRQGPTAVDLAMRAVDEARRSGALASLLPERFWVVSSNRHDAALVGVRVRDEGDALVVRSRWLSPDDDGATTLVHEYTIDASGVRHVTIQRYLDDVDAGGLVAHREDGVLRVLGARRDEVAAGHDLLPATFVAFVLPCLLERPDGRLTVPLRVLPAVDDEVRLDVVKDCRLAASPAPDGLLRVRLEHDRDDERAVVKMDALVQRGGEQRGSMVALVLGTAVCRPVTEAEATLWWKHAREVRSKR